ncbi:hypothetical protein DFA_07616 [Cavenderia fasciculata]|uniref:Tetratricopeptide-like helical domain-containing protein n=1 Tax=Cavenderia fasciculata TaxID=261658 RepID=F4Q652_CACFS|nr:uncharacterized protein DFA_07616 [Cavenderia fasciculata]EGG16638.1 hypothetical protein DFA_07616 [Cavenderia fasciculata]|eukprot:XP_004355112.1 hypothetical protein DFA_07616 [Cavenderia fasciculata]
MTNKNNNNNNNNSNSKRITDRVKKGQKKGGAPTKLLSFEQLVAQAEKYAEEYELEKAIDSFERALKMQPKDTTIMDALGELCIEIGLFDKATKHFVNSIKTNPNDSYTKYMNLGQLLGGQEAIKSYTKAIELMELQLQSIMSQMTPEQLKKLEESYQKLHNQKKQQQQEEEEEGQEEEGDEEQEDMMDDEEEVVEEEQEEEEPVLFLKDQLSSALCSLAELYLTDECFDDNAEMECEKNLRKAIGYAPYSPEPYSLLGSMKISQCKNEEALELISHSYTIWADYEIEDLPSLEYRFGIAQMFVELDQNRIAVVILESIVNQQDNIAEIWYTLGMVYHNLKEDRSAQDCLETALKLLTIVAKGGQDKELEDQIKSLLVTVNEIVATLPPEEDEVEEEEEQQMDDDQ